MSLNSFRQRFEQACFCLAAFTFLGLASSHAQGLPSAAISPPDIVPAQNTIHPDPNHDGSHYMYPVRTWTTPARNFLVRPDDGSPSRDEALTAATKRKLESTLLPDVWLHNVPFTRAIERLREESRKLDNHPGEGTWGVFIKMPSRAVAGTVPPGAPPSDPPEIGYNASTAASEPQINLRLRSIPLLDALRYVAQRARMKVVIGPGTVLFLPEDADTSPLITMELSVNPEWFDLVLYESKPWIPDSLRAGGHPVALVEPAERFLAARGVAFPAGSAATYLFQTSKLVVRNTQENLDKIKALVDQSPFAPDLTPTPANP